jgi:hypothetical protein
MCEPLYCSDSLLYFWAGLEEFNETVFDEAKLQNVHAIQLNEIMKIRFALPKSVVDCAKPAFCTTLVAGGIITAANFREQAASDALIFNGIFNLVFGSGLTFVIHLVSHIPKNIYLDSSIEFSEVIRKINRKSILNLSDNEEQINRLIKEIRP